MDGVELLPGSCLAWDNPPWGLWAAWQLMVTSKRACAKRDLPGLLLPVPLSLWWAAVNPRLQRRPSHTSRWFWSCGVTCWVTVCCEVTAPWLLLVCSSVLQDWCLCFPQSCGSPVVKSHQPSRSDSLGIPSPFVGSPGWEAWYGVQNLHSNGRTSLVLLFSSLWVTHPVGCGIWFYHVHTPPTISLQPLLCLWTLGIFFGWVPAYSYLWAFNSELQFWLTGDERSPFYSAILNQKPKNLYSTLKIRHFILNVLK